ncbi:ATP-dependent nuclease [Francisella philomiragia]|uniref:ATP-dependent nuclease n=1 Tax=Francisella philomiragia TaxID=28110 RepID=UPI001906CEC2|nr:AAA family ATPase [Francisella philomiragia]MBK2267706.1 ATP-binding protein [Francisella philomiragia]MBK2279195.1 ATP-binding protein [Francisella philomiragia]MBK2287016.1 ATP-binding protein [Francisella philomiragia]MBK2289027.1 ATP-binding protein [Francisella philomiragia]MBK2290745.1 ATP-binding protein [Francisella philomiragia]
MDNLSYTFLSYSESLKKVSQSSIFGGEKYNDTELLKKWDNDSPWAFLNKLFKEYGLRHTVNSPNKDSDNYTFTARISIDDENISFSDLSSGEKILCHLALLMFKSEYIRPKLLLLDEVDTNLHPSMIKNLINVINKVFIEKGTKVVLVTHSPTTVALADKDSIYEFKNNKIKNITQHKAIDILSEGLMLFDKEISYIKNALNTNKKLVLITEGDNNKFIEKAIRAIDESLLENTHIVKRAESITGDKQLKLFYDFFVAINPSIKILIVWDCDCVVYKSLESKNNVTPFVFEQNKNNNKVKKGVENLFREDIFSQTFYDTNTTLDDYGCEKINQIFNKKRFLDHILTINNKEDFSNFKPLINLIAQLIQCPK